MAAKTKAGRGGRRAGAGRPVGTVKTDARRNRLVMLLSDAELDAIVKAATKAREGVSTFARSVVLAEIERKGKGSLPRRETPRPLRG